MYCVVFFFLAANTQVSHNGSQDFCVLTRGIWVTNFRIFRDLSYKPRGGQTRPREALRVVLRVVRRSIRFLIRNLALFIGVLSAKSIRPLSAEEKLGAPPMFGRSSVSILLKRGQVLLHATIIKDREP